MLPGALVAEAAVQDIWTLMTDMRAGAKPSMEFSIVSGSNEELIVGCLDSLFAQLDTMPNDSAVTAICNTPGTGLAARLLARFPGIVVVENLKPKGFAANHNMVIRSSRADYVWILNDDLLFLPGCVQTVMDFMERPENARVAAVSPRLLNPDGSVQPSTYGFPSMPQTFVAHSGLRELRITEWFMSALAPLIRRRPGSSRFWAHDRTIDVDTVRGACVAVRMSAAREAGPMTEVALVGAEEMEWHSRFKKSGWKVVFLTDAEVVHYGSQTVSMESAQHYPEYLKGALSYFRASRGRLSYGLFCYALVAMFSVRKSLAALRRRRDSIELAKRYLQVAVESLRLLTRR